MNKKLIKIVPSAVFLIGILSYGSFVLLKRNGMTNNSHVNKKTFILEKYETELYRLDEAQINNLIANGNQNKGDLSYKIIDTTEDALGNIKIYLVEVTNNNDSPGLKQSEGIIAVDKKTGALLIDFESVWGYFHHDKDFDLNMKYRDIKNIVKDIDNDGKVEITINKETNNHDKIFMDIYRLSGGGFEYFKTGQ